MKRYYKIKDSVELKDFLEFDKSYDLKHLPHPGEFGSIG